MGLLWQAFLGQKTAELIFRHREDTANREGIIVSLDDDTVQILAQIGVDLLVSGFANQPRGEFDTRYTFLVAFNPPE
ncbi:MAG TPA: hypothetical protein VHN14_16420 [Kofleriaceae bacterium]|nr:hypothetical protein [Kofleriaceae bacterium]